MGQLGLDSRVRLDFRFAPATELPLFFEGADILAYPYREITSSGALMTGLSFDKAVIASGLPAFRELLTHDENAWLVTPGDSAALAEGLERLLSDPALRTRLAEGVAAWRSADSDQGWQAVAQATVACYRDALTGPSTGPNLARREVHPQNPTSPDLVQQ